MNSIANRIGLSLIAIVFTTLFHTIVFAVPNTANYTFETNTSGSLTNMANTTQLIRRNDTTGVSVVQRIGFDFVFMGEFGGNAVPMRYTHFSVTTKGYLALGTEQVPGNFPQALGVNLGMSVIAPFAANLRVSSTGSIRHRVLGNAPNRVLVVQWANMGSTTSSSTADMTFEARLYETTGVIEFVYGSMSQTVLNGSAQIGFASGLGSGQIGQIVAPQSGTPAPTYDAISTGTAANAYSIGPIPALSSASGGSRRVFRFTPNVASVPSNVGFSGVSATSVTVNWADNSSNETGFAVYIAEDLPLTRKRSYAPVELEPELEDLKETHSERSLPDDSGAALAGGFQTLPEFEQEPKVEKRFKEPELAGTSDLEGFEFAAAVGEGVTSVPITGLKPNTTYSFRVVALTEGAVSQAAAGDQSTLAAGSVVAAVAGGNWSDPATWQSNVVPTINDNVEIPLGTTVVIDQTGLLANDIVIAGVLEFTSDQNASLAVSSLLVQSGAILRASVTGTNVYTLNVSGDLTNNGTLDLSNASNTAGVNLFFSGKEDASFSGIGTVTNVFRITMDSKGFDGLPRTVTMDPQNFSVKGQTAESATGFLGLINGILRISGNFTGTHRVFSNEVFGNLLPLNTGIWIDNANFTFAAPTPQIRDAGLLRVSAGTVVLQSLMNISDLEIEGGQVSSSSPITVVNFQQSGGLITVGTGICSGSALRIDGNFETTSGTIVLQPSPTGCGSTNLAFDNIGAAFNLTGGTVQTGNASTGTAKTFLVSGNVFNLVTNGESANHLTNGTDLFVFGNTLIGANSRLTALRFVQLGPTFTNNGTLNATADATVSSFNFSGTGPQTYTGTGTGGTLTTPLQVVGFSNTNNVTIDPSSPVIITSRVNLFSGTVINSDRIQIGGSSTTALRLIQRGNATSQIDPPGEFDTAPLFNLGTAGLQLLYANAGTNIPTGFEVPTSRIVRRIFFSCPNGLLLTGGDLTVQNASPVGSLEISNGIFSTGPNKLIIGATTTVTRTNGHINGDIEMLYTATGTKTFHVGTANGYSPVTVNVTALGVAPSSLTVRANEVTHPNVPNAASALRRFWSLTESGDLAATLSFVYQQADVPAAVPESSLELRRYTGAGTVFDQIPATLDTATNTITTSSPISDFSDWTLFSSLSPTSAGVSISGRVSTGAEAASGIALARVVVTDANGVAVSALSNPFGVFSIEGLRAGETYFISVQAKGFQFEPFTLQVNEDISGLEITPEGAFLRKQTYGNPKDLVPTQALTDQGRSISIHHRAIEH